MQNYETMLIIRQDASANQVNVIADEIADIITEAKGKIARREYWGLRNLAYRIRKNRKGHYVLLNYSASAEVIDAINYKMRYAEDILRYMTITTEDLPSEDSVQMRRRDADGDGDRGYSTPRTSDDKGYRRTVKKEADAAKNDEETAAAENLADGE